MLAHLSLCTIKLASWLALQLSSGKAKLLASHVELCVVHPNEDFAQDPDVLGSWFAQKPTETQLPAP